jgi:hypothetical protein
MRPQRPPSARRKLWHPADPIRTGSVSAHSRVHSSRRPAAASLGRVYPATKVLWPVAGSSLKSPPRNNPRRPVANPFSAGPRLPKRAARSAARLRENAIMAQRSRPPADFGRATPPARNPPAGPDFGRARRRDRARRSEARPVAGCARRRTASARDRRRPIGRGLPASAAEFAESREGARRPICGRPRAAKCELPAACFLLPPPNFPRARNPAISGPSVPH